MRPSSRQRRLAPQSRSLHRAAPVEQQAVHHEQGSAERHRFGTELAHFYAHPARRVLESLPADGLSHAVDKHWAQLDANPSTDHDLFRVEQVHEVGDAGAEVPGHSLEGRRRPPPAPARFYEAVEPVFRIRVARLWRVRARTVPFLQESSCPYVRLEATVSAAPAQLAVSNDRCVPPFPRARPSPAVEGTVGEYGCPDTGAPKCDGCMVRAPPSSEPHLRLAERLGTVVSEDR